jgi:hypothetical protein
MARCFSLIKTHCSTLHYYKEKTSKDEIKRQLCLTNGKQDMYWAWSHQQKFLDLIIFQKKSENFKHIIFCQKGQKNDQAGVLAGLAY